MGGKPRASAGPSGLPPFESIWRRAAERKGGDAALEALLPAHAPLKLLKLDDDRALAEMAKNIFRAGFVWKIVENKWPGFEAAFESFRPQHLAGLDEQSVDELARDTRIIRNRQKIVSVRDNARFIVQVSSDHGSFGRFLHAWPNDDVVGLWLELSKRGSRLGGFTGQLFLRTVGVDTFMLTRDVNQALIDAGVVDKPATSKSALARVQQAFNGWQRESGHTLAQLSRVLACSVGP